MKKSFVCIVIGWVCSSAFGQVEHKTLAIGSKAPDFSLPAVDGKTYSLQSFKDAKVLAIIFTCNHCPTAQGYEERIIQLTKDYSSKGVQVVAINPNHPESLRLDELGWSDVGDSFDDMKVRAKEKNFNFPYLYDGDSETVSKAYGPVVTPHAFVFDATRKLRYVGAIDDSERIAKVTKHYLRDALDAVLADKEPTVAQTKVVGCSIKWAGKEATVKSYMAKLAAERRQAALQRAEHAGGDAGRMPVHAHHGAERLEPERMRQAAQQLVAAVMVDDRLAHDPAEAGHAIGEPARDLSAMQRKIGAS